MMTPEQIEQIKSHLADPHLRIMLAGRSVEEYASEYSHKPELYQDLCNDLGIPPEEWIA